jgi:hypothetical protein
MCRASTNCWSLESRESELFDYLWWLETEHMGLPGDRQATELFAHRLIENFARLDSEE